MIYLCKVFVLGKYFCTHIENHKLLAENLLLFSAISAHPTKECIYIENHKFWQGMNFPAVSATPSKGCIYIENHKF